MCVLLLAKHIYLCKRHECKRYTFTIASTMNSLYQTLQYYYGKIAVDSTVSTAFPIAVYLFMRLRNIFVYTTKTQLLSHLPIHVCCSQGCSGIRNELYTFQAYFCDAFVILRLNYFRQLTQYANVQ
jgi:hypothetical protein